VLNKGARIILLPTGPAYGRSPGDPYFDPIWSRMNEAGATLAFHIMENWYNENIAAAWAATARGSAAS
jgi:protoheme ferro-lyase